MTKLDVSGFIVGLVAIRSRLQSSKVKFHLKKHLEFLVTTDMETPFFTTPLKRRRGFWATWVTVIAFKQICVSSHNCAENLWNKKQQLDFYQKSSLSIQRQTFHKTLWKLYEANWNKSLTYARSASVGFVGWYAPDMFRIKPNNGTALLLISTDGIWASQDQWKKVIFSVIPRVPGMWYLFIVLLLYCI